MRVGQPLKQYWGAAGIEERFLATLLLPRTDDKPDPISPFFFFFFFQARWPFVDFETESQGKHLSCSNSFKTIINRGASSHARVLTKEDSGG